VVLLPRYCFVPVVLKLAVQGYPGTVPAFALKAAPIVRRPETDPSSEK
jgi:hypothetical protein